VVAQLPWDELARVAGERPRAFGFAGTLSSQPSEPNGPYWAYGIYSGLNAEMLERSKIHKFGDPHSYALNNGWATFLLDTTESVAEAHEVVTGQLEDLPSWARR